MSLMMMKEIYEGLGVSPDAKSSLKPAVHSDAPTPLSVHTDYSSAPPPFRPAYPSQPPPAQTTGPPPPTLSASGPPPMGGFVSSGPPPRAGFLARH